MLLCDDVILLANVEKQRQFLEGNAYWEYVLDGTLARPPARLVQAWLCPSAVRLSKALADQRNERRGKDVRKRDPRSKEGNVKLLGLLLWWNLRSNPHLTVT